MDVLTANQFNAITIEYAASNYNGMIQLLRESIPIAASSMVLVPTDN